MNAKRKAAALCRQLKRKRLMLGMTQMQLSKLAGVCQRQVCGVERGEHSPALDTYISIVEALKQASCPPKTRAA
jgi:predicted transcriptional regulator